MKPAEKLQEERELYVTRTNKREKVINFPKKFTDENIELTFVKNINEEKYNKFIEEHENGSLLQTIEWGKFKSKYGWSMELIGLENKRQELVAATMLLRKKIPVINKSILYAPRGFVIDYDNDYLFKTFTENIKEFAIATKAIFLKVDPGIRLRERDLDGTINEDGFNNTWLINKFKDFGYIHNGTGENVKGIQPRFVFVLDISQNKEKLLKLFHHKTRYNIKLAEKKGIEVYEGNREDLIEFDRIMKITGERDNFATRSLSYFQNMFDNLEKTGKLKVIMTKYNIKKALDSYEQECEKEINKKNPDEKRIEKLNNEIQEAKKLLQTHKDGIIVCGAILAIAGKKAYYLYGASDNVYRNLMPTYLMQWIMIQYAKEQGCTSYDFGGVSGALDSNHPYYGVYRFKRGFNGEIFEYIGEFELIINKFYAYMWEKCLPQIKKILSK